MSPTLFLYTCSSPHAMSLPSSGVLPMLTMLLAYQRLPEKGPLLPRGMSLSAGNLSCYFIATPVYLAKKQCQMLCRVWGMETSLSVEYIRQNKDNHGISRLPMMLELVPLLVIIPCKKMRIWNAFLYYSIFLSSPFSFWYGISLHD